jgi:hypothetical protein
MPPLWSEHVDRGAYIYEVCRDCQIIRCPPLTGWENYEDIGINDWTQTFQAIKPPERGEM